MAFEPKDMSGALFVNDRKEKPTQADRRGDCLINGKAYWVSGWIKDGKRGKWLSLSFKPKDGATKQQTANRMQAPPDLDDEIPF